MTKTAHIGFEPFETMPGGLITADGHTIGWVQKIGNGIDTKEFAGVTVAHGEIKHLFDTQADAMLAVISRQVSVYDVDMDAIRELVAPYHTH